MLKTLSRTLLAVLLLIGLPITVQAATPIQDAPTTRAVLFWLSTCPHCHTVIEDVLPPIQAQYGDRLDIILIELHTDGDFRKLYNVAATYGIPQENVGVPLMLIGDQILIGSGEIPARLPLLIDEYLATGGVDYPLMPGFSINQGVRFSVESEANSPVSNRPVASEVSGFGLAMVVMVGMLLALLYALAAWLGKARWVSPQIANWALPVLAVLGLSVSAYMAYVETTAVAAICGPIGDCNAVQSSDYARLFGVLPIGILGMVGYAMILIFWGWLRLRHDPLSRYAPRALFGLALGGVFFSLYLTYLEPFVIGAVCIWCLSSAVIMTLLLVVTLTPELKPAPVKIKGRRRRG